MAEEYSAYSDKELIQLVQAGRPDAFAELSSRYLWLIRSKAAQFQGAAAPEPEDLLQEGFLGLYAAAESFQEGAGAAFRTYAGTCIVRRMIDAARRHSSERNRPLNESLSLDSEAVSAMAAENSPEELIELRDQAESLFRRLEQELSPLERKAFSLYLSGCGRGEIEERSGMTLRAYDNAIYRVRNKLRQFTAN